MSDKKSNFFFSFERQNGKRHTLYPYDEWPGDFLIHFDQKIETKNWVIVLKLRIFDTFDI